MVDKTTNNLRVREGPPPPEVIYVDQHRISCDGGGGALGHPKVWYSLRDGEVTCGYCDRLFIYAPEKVG
ncbi:MAG: zinc-finger domain-containing protein [Pseudomonadota bacterium]